MSISALLVGRLVSAPEVRTGASGRPYVRARLLLPASEGVNTQYALLSIFPSSAQAVALALREGDFVAASGALRVSVWQPSNGSEPRVNLALTCDNLLTLHEHRRVGRAVQQARSQSRAEHAQAARQQPQDSGRAQREAAALWRGEAGGSGFDDMADDIPTGPR